MIKRKVLILISFFWLLVPDFSYADDLTAYAFGNADVFKAIMDAASSLTQDSSFKTLLYGIAVFSVLVYGAMSVGQSNQMMKIVTLIFLVLGLVSFGIDGKTNVKIYDPVFGKTQYSTNVPNIIAYPVSVITTVGHTLSQKTEEHFSGVDDRLKVSQNGGFNLGNSLIKASTQVKPTSKYLRMTINNYMDNCIVPELANGSLSINDIMASTNLWLDDGIMGNSSKSLWTVAYSGNSPDGVALPCISEGESAASTATITSKKYPSVSAGNAFDYISKYFKAAADDWFITNAGLDQSTKTSQLSALAAAHQELMSGNGVTSTLLAQSAGVNMLNSTISQMASRAGVDNTALAFGIAQAEASQRAAWASNAVIFNDMIGYIFSVLQVFLIGIIPLIIAFTLLPGGVKILINYGLILLWLATWEPILAIINYVILSYSKGQYSDFVPKGEYTFDTLPFASAMSDNFILAASFLATVTPLVSWGIIKGGMAFTSFVSSALGQQYGAKAGEVGATGNISYNNYSANNTSTNKFDTAHSVSSGFSTPLHNVASMGARVSQDMALNVSPDLIKTFQATKNETLSALTEKGKILATELGNTLSQIKANERQVQDILSKGLGSSTAVQHGRQASTDHSHQSGVGSGTHVQGSDKTALKDSNKQSSQTANEKAHAKEETDRYAGMVYAEAKAGVSTPKGSPVDASVTAGARISREMSTQERDVDIKKEVDTKENSTGKERERSESSQDGLSSDQKSSVGYSAKKLDALAKDIREELATNHNLTASERDLLQRQASLIEKYQEQQREMQQINLAKSKVEGLVASGFESRIEFENAMSMMNDLREKFSLKDFSKVDSAKNLKFTGDQHGLKRPTGENPADKALQEIKSQETTLKHNLDAQKANVNSVYLSNKQHVMKGVQDKILHMMSLDKDPHRSGTAIFALEAETVQSYRRKHMNDSEEQVINAIKANDNMAFVAGNIKDGTRIMINDNMSMVKVGESNTGHNVWRIDVKNGNQWNSTADRFSFTANGHAMKIGSTYYGENSLMPKKK